MVNYLNYLETIRGLSLRTVNGYYIDLRTFFRFLAVHKGLVTPDTSPDEIDISGIGLPFIKQIAKADVYDFLYYTTRERENNAATRARKLSSLKGFFKYLTSRMGLLEKNPADDVERPAQKKRLPVHLNLDESVNLLNNIQSDFFERDYCVITLFLNCGMRLSELVGININDISEEKLRLLGKGNKERIVYLNTACLLALEKYTQERAKLQNLRDNKALFVSKRTGRRLTARRIQQIVNGCLQAAGLDGKGYSVHKLRHTAATLMYQHGHVDLLSLREILGHVDVSTTQIYTHLDTLQLKKAAESSPLSGIHVENTAGTPQIDGPGGENTPSGIVENNVEKVENIDEDE